MTTPLPADTKRCLYCGNNPTNHHICYISQSTLALGMPLCTAIDFFMRPTFHTAIHNTIVTWWMRLSMLLHVISFQNDHTKACSGRSRVIWDEAIVRGIKMEQLVIARRPVEQYRAYMHGRWHYFTSLPIPPHADRRAYVWMDSKVHLKKFLQKHGVRVPQGGPAYTQKSAEAIFNRIEKPVIVKPESGSRGRHSLTHLSTLTDLKHGFKIAQQLCCSVVVEEHLMGSVYRATYVGGEIVGILRGDPPRVLGDGNTTVRELIIRKNQSRPKEVAEVTESPMVSECIKRQGYTYDSILEDGKRIDLREKIGLSYGGDAIEEYPLTHPQLLAQLKKAGDVIGAPIIGFDFISEDITKNPDTIRWGIIEANSMPFIDLHHDPRLGTPINVAGKVWDMWKRGV